MFVILIMCANNTIKICNVQKCIPDAILTEITSYNRGSVIRWWREAALGGGIATTRGTPPRDHRPASQY